MNIPSILSQSETPVNFIPVIITSKLCMIQLKCVYSQAINSLLFHQTKQYRLDLEDKVDEFKEREKEGENSVYMRSRLRYPQSFGMWHEF